MLLNPPKYRRGSALLTAIVSLTVLAVIAALFAPVLITGGRLVAARDDAAHAKTLAQGYFEYATALIYADTFGRDGIAYNNDDGDEGYDWLGDDFGGYTLAQLRDGVEIFNGHSENLSASVRLRIVDHESLANINVHGNFYGPDCTTNVGHGVSPAEIALERAIAAAELPESIFPDEAEAAEAAHKLARQIISSARFYAIPDYFPGGARDRLDNHARKNYLGGADANRTGFAEPHEFTRELNDFADNTTADSGFPSFFAQGPSQERFGLDTELALQYARFYPDDPNTEAGRVEDFARDDRAGRLIEKNRLFLHCLRAVDDDTLKARALFAAVAERVCTFSGDPDVAPDMAWRININDDSAPNIERLYALLQKCDSLNVNEARQVVANLKAYLADSGSKPVESADRSFMGYHGLARFLQFSEVWFSASGSRRTLYVELGNPFLTAPAAEGADNVAIDLSGMEIRLRLVDSGQVYVARLSGAIPRGTAKSGRGCFAFRLGTGPARIPALNFSPALSIDAIDSPEKIESLELWCASGVGNPFPDGPLDRIPWVVLAACSGVSRERIDLLGAAGDLENWAASQASRGQTLTLPNSVALPGSDAVCASYLEIGGDGNRFATVGEFFRLLAIGPSYDPRTGGAFESMADFVEYLSAHREDTKLFCRLSSRDKAMLYDALTSCAPLPEGFVRAEDRFVREGRINVNTALRGTLLALPFVGENYSDSTIDADDLIDEFQGGDPAQDRSDLARYSRLNAWGDPLVPRSRFPNNFDSSPLSRARIEHPEEKEFVPALMQKYLTTRSNVFTVLVEVELRSAAGRVVARERLVGIIDRSRPADANSAVFSPRLRVILRHFLDWD